MDIDDVDVLVYEVYVIIFIEGIVDDVYVLVFEVFVIM